MSETADGQKNPVICSLQNLEIQLNDEIREHLRSQYDANPDNESDDKLEHILAAMKRPPAFTTCRVILDYFLPSLLSRVGVVLFPFLVFNVLDTYG